MNLNLNANLEHSLSTDPLPPPALLLPLQRPISLSRNRQRRIIIEMFPKKVCIAIKGPSKAWHKHRPRLYAIRVVLLRPLPHTNPQTTIRAVVSIVNDGKVARVKL